MSERLRFSPSILARLGEELVPQADQGIMELVKNAYDADALRCTVKLERTSVEGGAIRVVDDGSGMTEADLVEGFLVVGRSRKAATAPTRRLGRIQVGDKGLGRLSAMRLGRKVVVLTRPFEEPGIELRLELNWDKFDEAIAVEEVELSLVRSPTTKGHGTEIHIENLRAPFPRGTADKLARNLLLLSDPFREIHADSGGSSDPGFTAELEANEFEDLQSKVETSYFRDADFRIRGTLNDHGEGQFSLLDWKGEVLYSSNATRTYEAPKLEFDLWHFVLDAGRFSNKSSTLPEVRAWLKHIGGVHVYQDGIRVPAYGGPGNDWLDLNLLRVRSPELRPGTNTSIGRVGVSNTAGALVQKTDRVGYLESEAFHELRRFCIDTLDWAAKVRVSERESGRRAERDDKSKRTAKASASLDKVLAKTVPDTQRKVVDNAIERVLRANEQETKVLREELQLYRSLATAGMTSAVFAHEIGRPLELLDTNLGMILKMIPEDRRKDADRRVGRITRQKERLNSFISIPLKLLAKSKRRRGRVDIDPCVRGLVDLIAPVLGHFNVEMEVSLNASTSAVSGSEALIEGVLLNLVTNSINAFQRRSTDVETRRIRISTAYDGDVLIMVEDNAGGIKDFDVSEIFLPGVTSQPDGTGFGLTIVRDSVSDLSGKIDVDPLTEFGGAKFTIKLFPMRALFE
ncbi:ATP-binding protein [Tianweitania sp. BSSL-BM11]|uniref:ATP-binding protein n=1 Tax=Tianweitania aestuarii TaxID=2814886 RepID=A0ABS5RWR7_9HYPH|nr:ATP-binding protein [Tianweitania aestuarii]MBS9721503.1 ATP-binding protein [Tianweitania aestuarii]